MACKNVNKQLRKCKQTAKSKKNNKCMNDDVSNHPKIKIVFDFLKSMQFSSAFLLKPYFQKHYCVCTYKYNTYIHIR